jgi:hypothetical protein
MVQGHQQHEIWCELPCLHLTGGVSLFRRSRKKRSRPLQPKQHDIWSCTGRHVSGLSYCCTNSVRWRFRDLLFSVPGFIRGDRHVRRSHSYSRYMLKLQGHDMDNTTSWQAPHQKTHWKASDTSCRRPCTWTDHCKGRRVSTGDETDQDRETRRQRKMGRRYGMRCHGVCGGVA